MWFYQQAMRQYQDPKVAVRHAAELRRQQRQQRLAAMEWYGLSNSRPRASSDPFHGDYSPGWAANNLYYPYRWTGAAGPLVVVNPDARPLLPLDEFLADGPNRRLRAVGDADLAEDVLHVLLHGFVADVQRLGDFLVGQAVGQLAEHFAFPLG